MRVHLSTSNVIRKGVGAVATGALVFAMLGSSALAAPPVVRDHIASRGAGAGNLVCNGPECTSTSVFVSVNTPDGPSQACLDISRYEMVGTNVILLGWETGCAELAEGSFSIDTKSLTGAALSTTEVTLQAYECDATGCSPTGSTRTAQISATYTGVGEVTTFRSNSKSTFGGCTMYLGGKGSSRNATATLTINGQSFEAPGSLFTSTQRVKVLCH